MDNPTVPRQPCPLDPYVDVEEKIITNLAASPPAVGTSPNTSNTLKIHVPSDDAKIVMGLHTPNGVSAYAETNVSLKAKASDSSLSVGVNTDVNGGAEGISLNTNGKLTEIIKTGREIEVKSGGSTEKITGLRETTNTGEWNLKTTANRTDTVMGDYTINVPTNNITTSCPAGNYTLTCNHEKRTALGNQVDLICGQVLKTRMGMEQNFFFGIQTNLNVAFQTNINASIVNNVFAMKNEYCLNENKWVTFNKKDMAMFLSTAALVTLLHTTEIKKSQINLRTSSAYISTATITVMK